MKVAYTSSRMRLLSNTVANSMVNIKTYEEVVLIIFSLFTRSMKTVSSEINKY